MNQEVNFDVYLYKFDLDFPIILTNKEITEKEYQNTINTLNRILTKNQKTNSFFSVILMILFLLFIIFDIFMIILGIILFFVGGRTGSVLLCKKKIQNSLLGIFIGFSVCLCACVPYCTLLIPFIRYYISRRLLISVEDFLKSEIEKIYSPKGVVFLFSLTSQLIPGYKGWSIVAIPKLYIVDNTWNRNDLRNPSRHIVETTQNVVPVEVDISDDDEPFPLQGVKFDQPTMYKQHFGKIQNEKVLAPELVPPPEEIDSQYISFSDHVLLDDVIEKISPREEENE
jgi:hypothetical protein